MYLRHGAARRIGIHLPCPDRACCACAEANATLCFRYEWTSARRKSADEALKQALRLQPELPEVHLAYARHLYGVDRDYEKARAELAIARRGLPNDIRVILAVAWIARRQGKGGKPSGNSVQPLASIRAILLRACI
jgi:Tfp pilus assembly protein PilF